MKYTMKSGVLYEEASRKEKAKIERVMIGPLKKIFKEGSGQVLETDIIYPDESKSSSGDVRDKEYVMKGTDGSICAVGCPEYAEGDNPDVIGWPVCRLPRVDHAKLTMDQNEYKIIMHNSQNYAVTDTKGTEVLRIMHKGITGGWSIEDDHKFKPELICGMFVFCRYIEQENEFLIV